MNKKDLKAVLFAYILGSATFVAPVMADENSVTDGWSDDGYYHENGQKLVSQFKTFDGKTYYF